MMVRVFALPPHGLGTHCWTAPPVNCGPVQPGIRAWTDRASGRSYRSRILTSLLDVCQPDPPPRHELEELARHASALAALGQCPPCPLPRDRPEGLGDGTACSTGSRPSWCCTPPSPLELPCPTRSI